MEKNEMNNLIQKAMKGDEEAFEALCKEKTSKILYMTTRTLGNQQDGEDAAQTVMLHMFRNLKKLKAADAFEPWLNRIIVNTCNSFWRKWGKYKDDVSLEDYMDIQKEGPDIEPELYVEQKEFREEVLKAIDTLSYSQRQCVLMFYYEQLSYEEISQIMGVTVSAVNNRLYKARKRIGQKLEELQQTQLGSKRLMGVNILTVFTLLPQIFARDAAELVTSEMGERIIANVMSGVSGAGSLAAAQGGAKSMAAHSAMGAGTKAVIGITLAVSISAGGYVAGKQLLHETPPREPEQTMASEEVAITEMPQIIETTPAATVMAETPEATPIHTVEDMIGSEQAQTLLRYAEGNEDMSAFESFMEKIEMEADVVTVKDEVSYTLYYQDKQDKRLMIINKSGPEGSQVSYHFTDTSEEMPYGPMLFAAFEAWQGQN